MKSLAKLLGVILMVCLATSQAADWPQFLGPERNSTSPEKGILRAWPETGPEVLWMVPVGIGFGGPVIKDGRCTCSIEMGDIGDNLQCFDLPPATWNYAYDAPGRVLSGSRSVPAAEDYVYSCGHNGDLY